MPVPELQMFNPQVPQPLMYLDQMRAQREGLALSRGRQALEERELDIRERGLGLQQDRYALDLSQEERLRGQSALDEEKRQLDIDEAKRKKTADLFETGKKKFALTTDQATWDLALKDAAANFPDIAKMIPGEFTPENKAMVIGKSDDIIKTLRGEKQSYTIKNADGTVTEVDMLPVDMEKAVQDGKYDPESVVKGKIKKDVTAPDEIKVTNAVSKYIKDNPKATAKQIADFAAEVEKKKAKAKAEGEVSGGRVTKETGTLTEASVVDQFDKFSLDKGTPEIKGEMYDHYLKLRDEGGMSERAYNETIKKYSDAKPSAPQPLKPKGKDYSSLWK